MDTTQPLPRNALEGSVRSQAVAGSRSRVKRPVSSSMLRGGEHFAQTWGDGGRALWLTSGGSIFFWREREKCLPRRVRAHEVYCLKRPDVDFFQGESELKRGRWSTADRIKVRFEVQR